LTNRRLLKICPSLGRLFKPGRYKSLTSADQGVTHDRYPSLGADLDQLQLMSARERNNLSAGVTRPVQSPRPKIHRPAAVCSRQCTQFAKMESTASAYCSSAVSLVTVLRPTTESAKSRVLGRFPFFSRKKLFSITATVVVGLLYVASAVARRSKPLTPYRSRPAID
jgi:hypothetical protein